MRFYKGFRGLGIFRGAGGVTRSQRRSNLVLHVQEGVRSWCYLRKNQARHQAERNPEVFGFPASGLAACGSVPQEDCGESIIQDGP